MKFLVVIEKGKNNYSAYSPDVLGCVATGKTIEVTLTNMKEALSFHIVGMLESGEKMPIPKSLNYYLETTDEISDDEILAHIDLEFSELALA
jgi:predicted RNase H-like HicB family nuclease